MFVFKLTDFFVSRSIFRSVVERVQGVLRRGAQSAETTSSIVKCNLLKSLRIDFPLNFSIVSQEVMPELISPNNPHILRFKVGLKNDTEESIIYLNLIAKVVADEERIDVMKNYAYLNVKKEIVMYRFFMSVLERFQMSWGPLERRYCDLFPKCLGANFCLLNDQGDNLEPGIAIVTQNLKKIGFSGIMAPCSADDAIVIVKRLALLHATPLAASYQAYDPYLPRVRNALRIIPPEKVDFHREYDRICSALAGQLDWPQNMPKIRAHLLNYCMNISHRNIEPNSIWATVCHSKCSMRKIMIKRNTGENSVPDIKFLGLHHLQLDSCASDVMFFLLTSVHRDVLNSDYISLKSIYFMEFHRLLSYNFIELPEYTFFQFVDECRRQVPSNIARIFCEIGRLYHDGERGRTPVMGTNYCSKLIDAYNRTKKWF